MGWLACLDKKGKCPFELHLWPSCVTQSSARQRRGKGKAWFVIFQKNRFSTIAKIQVWNEKIKSAMLINWFLLIFLKQLDYLIYHFKTFWCFFKEVPFLNFSFCQSYLFLAFFSQLPSVLLFCKQRCLFILSQLRKPKQVRSILEIIFTFQLKVIPGVNLYWVVYQLLVYLFFRQTGKLSALCNKLWSFICLG